MLPVATPTKTTNKVMHLITEPYTAASSQFSRWLCNVVSFTDICEKWLPQLTLQHDGSVLENASVTRCCLHSADTMTLQVPSTRQATLGDCALLVAAAWAWNSLPPETRACSSLLTFYRETESHLFRQSYGWLGTIYSDRQQTSTLSCTTVLCINFVKCPRNSVMVAL